MLLQKSRKTTYYQLNETNTICGIIAGFNTTLKGKKNKTEKINNFIIDQYQDQCSRGTRGFGIIRIQEDGKIELDRATQEMKFMLDLYLKPAKMIIAHHRQPTSSDNKLNQTHPIFISNKMLNFDYYFIHNGIINNDSKLKTKHYNMGFKYTTEYEKEGYTQYTPTTIKFNDSEALGVEVALFIEEKQNYVETTNSAAFISLQINKKTHKAEKVFFGRSGFSSCLNLSKIKGNIKISSEGEGEEVIIDTLWSFNPRDPKMKLTSRGMEFKEIKEEVIETKTKELVPFETSINDKKETTNTPNTESNNGELITIEERSWQKRKIDESITEVNYEEEEIFVDKNYQEETIQAFKETIKEDDTEMIETSLESELDDQVLRINKIMENYQKIIQTRRTHPTERGWYLSQTFKILSTMDKIAEIAEEDYNEKLIQEEIKVEEEKDIYNTNHIGYRVSNNTQNFHNHRNKRHEEIGDLDWERFG